MAALGMVLAVSTVLAGPADAIKPSCRIVTDPSGDATNVPGTGQRDLPNQDDVDITSADVATNSSYVTTVVRVLNLGSSLSSGPEMRQYLVFFHLGKTDYYTEATHRPDGDVFWLNGGAPDENPSQVTGTTNYTVVSGVFDVAHNEVRVNVRRHVFSKDQAVKRGALITQVSAMTTQGVGSSTAVGAGAGGQEDTTTDSPPGRYVIDSPSCVKPGP